MPAEASLATSSPSDNRIVNAVLLGLALGLLVLHCATNGQYGFHRDELATVNDARHLAWGYVAYPPVTPFFGRLSLALFGDSLRGIRLFPAMVQALVVVLAGLMARELGGGRLAQIVSAVAVAVAPVSLAAGALYQYVAFDFFWWVLLAYLLLRLLRTENERLWMAIGAVIGLGVMTKYTMAFLVVGIAVGVLGSDLRRYLKSRWLWMGVALSLLIFLPNAIWQIQHHFITLDFLRYIHARDVRIGRTKDFLPEQLWIGANFLTIPLWLAGLYFYFVHPEGKQFRLLGWMFVVPFVLFVIAKGRGYYLAPAYSMLLAAGSVMLERWVASLRQRSGQRWARAAVVATFSLLALGGVAMGLGTLPILPINSALFEKVDSGDFREEIGWPELVKEVARIRDTLSAEERAHLGIFATNYGEAGAMDIYGGAYGLPQVIGWTNSYWIRGYPEPPPQTVIVLGLHRDDAEYFFESCQLAGHNGNPYGIKNEESEDHPDIFVCHNLKQPWPEFWKNHRHFG